MTGRGLGWPGGRAESSHDYALDGRGGERFDVRLGRGGFNWPTAATGREESTAVLEVVVHTRPTFPGFAPVIETRIADRVQLQAFGRRASGRRYLILPPPGACTPEGAAVSMTGRRIRWRPGPTRLFLFQNPRIGPDTRVLVVAPHPDDAEIAAFALYAASDSVVLTLTAGDAGGRTWGRLFPQDHEHYRIKGQIRTWDSITVPRLGGVLPHRARNLGYYDGTLASMYWAQPESVEPRLARLPDPAHYRRLNVDPELRERRFEASWPALRADLAREVDRVAPAVIAAPNPLLDPHADHAFATVALIEALERRRWAGRLLLYAVVRPHPPGPSTAVAGLPPWPGGELPFRSVFSWPLSEHTRRIKALALEAMHDIRRFDDRAVLPSTGPVPGATLGERLRARGPEIRSVFGRSHLLRIGARPNELFLVLDLEDAGRLKDRFLASNPRPPLPESESRGAAAPPIRA